MSPNTTFTGIFSHPLADMGEVRITYEAPGKQGLWLYTRAGHKRGQVDNYAWRVAKPSDELLTNAVMCGLGLMPPWAFADWLEEHADVVKPISTRFENETLEQFEATWVGFLSELRRFAHPYSDPHEFDVLDAADPEQIRRYLETRRTREPRSDCV